MSETTKPSIAEITRAGIKDGKDNKAILEEVKTAYPEAKTTLACVNWYRYNDGKRKSGAKKSEQIAKLKAHIESLDPEARKEFLDKIVEENLDKIINSLPIDCLKPYLPKEAQKVVETQEGSEPSNGDAEPEQPKKGPKTNKK